MLLEAADLVIVAVFLFNAHDQFSLVGFHEEFPFLSKSLTMFLSIIMK